MALTLASVLDLGVPGERAAQDLIRRFSTGRWPLWRLLAMRRSGRTLWAAVLWRRSGQRTDGPFSLVAVALDEVALRWRDFPSGSAACAALAQLDDPEHDTAPSLPLAVAHA